MPRTARIHFYMMYIIYYILLSHSPLCEKQTRGGRGFDSQPEGLGVAFFATGPGLGLIMYILTTLEFPTNNIDFHLLTTSVNAKYYDYYY